MITSRTRFLVLVALAAACEPSIPQTPAPSAVTTAVFDPIAGNIPLPNDLARLPRPAGSPPFPAAQQDLINLFNTQGGFPSDQELPVTISLVRTVIAADGTATNTAPTLDPTTVVNGSTLVVYLNTQGASGLVAIDPITDANYVSAGDHGVLSIHNKNRAPWTPGQYVVGLRGGPNGVKTKEGDPIYASTTFYLIAQGQNLETEQNLTLLRAQTGSEAAARAAAQQLDQIIHGYNQGAFQAVNTVFPHEELAAMTTFTVAPVTGTVVEVDSSRGIVPLPIDLLRDPRPTSASCAACGRLTPLAACTLAQGTLDAQGVCHDSKGQVSAAAAGFATLDGFSTTGMMLMPTSGLVQRTSVTSSTVQLWDLANPAAPVKVNPSTYITEPVEVTQQGLSPVIALQPAGATADDPTSVFRTRPLTESTDYAVVVSNGVLDKTGKGIVPGTVARILRFSNPISVGGKSQLVGIDDQTASALEAMRLKLPPVIAASGFASDQIAIAYTFRTQSILSIPPQLAALPYPTGTGTLAPLAPPTLSCASTSLNPACASAPTVDAAYSAYGIATSVPRTNVGFIVEAKVPTFSKLRCPAGDANCKDTGAFSPATVQPVVESIDVLIALPAPPYVGSCTPSPTTVCTIPLLVFRHGLSGGRADMLRVADKFNANGIGVAAIDAAKHGDRSYCKADTECAGGATCVPDPEFVNEGDAPAPSPGRCKNADGSAGDFARRPGGPKAIPLASSNYLVSANFFRTRDTLRQDVIDQSQLVRVLSPDPTGTQPANLITTPLLGVQFDNAKIWYAGVSLGAIQGAVNVAAIPRISETVLNVGGGTIVDVFTTSPAFSSNTNTLLAALGIQPGTSAYLQFLVVAKTILDPADPVNFAGHLTGSTLPYLLANPNGTVFQAPKPVLAQAAYCDQVVPNPFNFILDSTAGTAPMPLVDPLFGTGTGTFQLFYKFTGTTPDLTTCPAPGGTNIPANAVSHGFFADFSDPAMTDRAQTDAAAFLQSGTLPSSLVVLP